LVEDVKVRLEQILIDAMIEKDKTSTIEPAPIGIEPN